MEMGNFEAIQRLYPRRARPCLAVAILVLRQWLDGQAENLLDQWEDGSRRLAQRELFRLAQFNVSNSAGYPSFAARAF